MRIRLYRDIYIASPWPALFIEGDSTLVMSDLHLGIEGYLEDEGIFLPRSVSRSTADMVFKAVDDYSPDIIIFNGDLKHSFGLLKTSEWRELTNFFRRLRDEYNLEVYVVRGNHDNYLGVLLDKFGYEMVEKYDKNYYSIIHGHRDYDLDDLNEVVIIGHEHPSIVVRDESGGKYRYKCFLYGDYGDKKVIVLPPVSEISTGTTYNMYELIEPMSPFLRKFDLGKLRPYAIVPGETVVDLPPLEVLRSFL